MFFIWTENKTELAVLAYLVICHSYCKGKSELQNCARVAVINSPKWLKLQKQITYNRHFVSAIGTNIFRFGFSKARYALSFLGEHCPIFLAD